ncbi:hypothetical protein AYI70_g3463 [Smittium culicis]|uniref:ARID4A/B PWWP domain-containing protein n=1 Tax=Smittium culicis TaxID=133412 RepID=A0A1R1Y3K5_9FUNG|nr:hypothetical protein AYI70_g3463 [Smittium culicis]
MEDSSYSNLSHKQDNGSEIKYNDQTLQNTENSTWEHKQIVFVDPLDRNTKYWWAAMIVPKSEIDSSMNCDAVTENECVVRYFEDNKFSIVPYSDLAVFDINKEPYLRFKESAGSELDLDSGIQLALEYLNSGKLPTDFKWAAWEQQTTSTFKKPNSPKS